MPLYIALSLPALYFLGAVSSLVAAIYWYRASLVTPPNTLFGVAPSADPELRTNGIVDFGKGSNAFVEPANTAG